MNSNGLKAVVTCAAVNIVSGVLGAAVGAVVLVGLYSVIGSDYSSSSVVGGFILTQMILPYIDIYRANSKEG